MRQQMSPEQRAYLQSILVAESKKPEPAATRLSWWARLSRSIRRLWPLRLLTLIAGLTLADRSLGQDYEADYVDETPPAATLSASPDEDVALMEDILLSQDARLAALETKLDELAVAIAGTETRGAAPGEPLGETAPAAVPSPGHAPSFLETLDGWALGGALVGSAALVVLLLWPTLKKSPATANLVPSQEKTPARLQGGRPATAESAASDAVASSLSRHIERELTAMSADVLPVAAATVDGKHVGFASFKGHVRERQEDAGICFEIEGRKILVVGDGMGGAAHGDLASRAVVGGAVKSVIGAFGCAPAIGLDPATVAAVAVGAGQRAVARLARARDLGPDSCRSTLIVAVLDGDTLGFAYIGDGCGYVRRAAGGSMERFLVPMTDGPGSTAIYGSLGPALDGTPVVGRMRVEPGDLVVVATDGVSERADAKALADDLFFTTQQCGGDVHRAANRVLDSLINQRDERGYICDDNATLGVIAVPLLAAPHVQRSAAAA